MTGVYSLLYGIFGSVTLRLCGGFFGSFLNMCRDGGVICRNVRYFDGSMYIDISPQEIYKIRHIARRTAMRVKIEKRRGLVFFTNRHRKRVGFALGFVFFLAINFYLSDFVWNVDIVGQSEYCTKEQILSALSDLGIYEGAKLDGFDADAVENEILLKYNNLKRLAISVIGTNVTVELKDKTEPQKNDETTEPPCDIAARCDAYILSVSPYCGEAAVRPGDTVSRGQILIFGRYTDRTGRDVAVPARGEIIGQTVHDAELEISRRNEKLQPTGRKYQKNSIFFFGIRINLFADSGNRYDKCDIIFERNRLELFGVKLPVYIDKKTVTELAAEDRYLTKEELTAKAKEAIAAYENEVLKDCVIISRSVGVSADGDTCRLKLRYVCEENIGETKETVFENGE